MDKIATSCAKLACAEVSADIFVCRSAISDSMVGGASAILLLVHFVDELTSGVGKTDRTICEVQ